MAIPFREKIAKFFMGITLLIYGLPILASGSNNCDIRKLELTQMQKVKLRSIRTQYKHKINTNLQRTANNQQASEQLNHILMKSSFDEVEARRYVLNHYIPQMQHDVDELKVQYEFLQVLNPHQRQNWINNCLR